MLTKNNYFLSVCGFLKVFLIFLITKSIVLAYGPSFTLSARTYLMSGSGGKIFLEAAYSRSAFNKYSVDKKKYELDETDPMPQYHLGIGLAF